MPSDEPAPSRICLDALVLVDDAELEVAVEEDLEVVVAAWTSVTAFTRPTAVPTVLLRVVTDLYREIEVEISGSSMVFVVPK